MTKHIKKILNWKVWIQGAVSALIGGAANAVSAMVVDPVAFNFQGNLKALLSLAAMSGVISLFLFLKQSPIPPEIEVEYDLKQPYDQ
jgi:hypothetical protein